MTLLNKHIQAVLFAVLLFGLLFTVANAHEEDGDEASLEVRASASVDLRGLSPAEIEARRENAKQAAEARREAAQEALEAKREEVKANLQARREETKGAFEARREEIKANIEARREAFNEDAEARKEGREERHSEIEATLKERAEARIQLHLDRFTTILGAAIDRMYGLIDRITERADAMDADGKDTSAAREHLDLAVSELVAAEGDLASIEADLDATVSIDPAELTREILKQAFADTKDAIESAKRHIRAAHEEIRNALAALRAEADVEAEAEASAE